MDACPSQPHKSHAECHECGKDLSENSCLKPNPRTNRVKVVGVRKLSVQSQACRSTREVTLERDLLNVMNVGSLSNISQSSSYIRECTPGRNHLNVMNVENVIAVCQA